MHDFNSGHHICRGQQIVGIGGRQRLPLFVIAHPLKERGTNAMNNATQDLSIHHHLIDDATTVVHDQVTMDHNPTRFHIHLNLSQVGPVGVGQSRRLKIHKFGQTRFQSFG